MRWIMLWPGAAGGDAGRGALLFALVLPLAAAVRRGASSGASCKFRQIRANASREVATNCGPNEPEIPLPSLARADLDGGEADEPTRAKVLLRAALEAANAR